MTTTRHFRARLTHRTRAIGRRLADDRGDVAVIETLLWIPLVVALLTLMAGALRQHTTAAIAQDAAQSAARAAARAADSDSGRRAATESLESTLADHPGTCDATVDTTTWNTGTATVSVTCTTSFAGLDHLTFGPHHVTRTWAETVDNARIARTGPNT
jgi:Flp pilus assembly protein TadG